MLDHGTGGTGLNTLENTQYRRTPAPGWTARSSRVTTFKTHVHQSAEYPVENISVHFSLLYTPRAPCISLKTRQPVHRNNKLSTDYHVYTKDVTVYAYDVISVVLKDFLTHVQSRYYTHGSHRATTSSTTEVYASTSIGSGTT